MDIRVPVFIDTNLEAGSQNCISDAYLSGSWAAVKHLFYINETARQADCSWHRRLRRQHRGLTQTLGRQDHHAAPRLSCACLSSQGPQWRLQDELKALRTAQPCAWTLQSINYADSWPVSRSLKEGRHSSRNNSGRDAPVAPGLLLPVSGKLPRPGLFDPQELPSGSSLDRACSTSADKKQQPTMRLHTQYQQHR